MAFNYDNGSFPNAATEIRSGSVDVPMATAYNLFAVLSVGLVCYSYLQHRYHKGVGLTSVAVIGAAGYFSSWKTVVSTIFGWRALLNVGCCSHETFQIPTPGGFLTFVSTSELLGEVFRAPETVLSMKKYFRYLLHGDCLVPGAFDGIWAAKLVRVAQTIREDLIIYDELDQEVKKSVRNLFPPTKEWTVVKAFPTIEALVIRVGSRAITGLPLADSEPYLHLLVKLNELLPLAALLLYLVPKPFRLFFAENFLWFWTRVRLRGENILIPVIEQKLAGEDPDNSITILNGLVAVMRKTTKTRELEPTVIREIAGLVLFMNAVTIDEAAKSCCRVVFEITNRPEYIPILRDEIAQVKARTSSGDMHWVGRLPKMESFIKETFRHNSTGIVGQIREAQRPITLSNGLRFPAGACIGIPTQSIHMDAKVYPDPTSFRGLRFYNPTDEEGSASAATNVSSTSYLAFGHGTHACPGRFLSVTIIKLFLVELLEGYDIRQETEGKLPKNVEILATNTPSYSAGIRVRVRGQ